MKEDASLFKYELAICAIFKGEAPYVKEWLDYHLMAGADHFYIYDNESPDNLTEVLKPYIENGIVEYTMMPGKFAQVTAYNDAVDKHKFECRYMAFIDADEFILPRGNKSIKDVLHEILDNNPIAAALTPNWYIFGSGGQEKADFTRGVTERFTYRQSKIDQHIKTIANPRFINFMPNCHHGAYFDGKFAVDECGRIVQGCFNPNGTAARIGINHYFFKSKEEFLAKIKRGTGDHTATRPIQWIENDMNDKTVVFDDEIIKYKEVCRTNKHRGGE